MCEVKRFSRGETLYRAGERSGRLGIVTDGRLKVVKNSDGRHIVINTLSAGDVFGASTLFSDEGFTNEIIAQTKGSASFITRAALTAIMEKYPAVTENYISYLTGRINFLSRRIGSLTQGDAPQRLRAYLEMNCGQSGVFSGNMSELAKTLNMGRASLYRAVASLKKDGTLENQTESIKLRGKNT